MIKKIQSGFTLIELVMVMVIVGILAAVALPKYVDMSGAAKSTAGKAGSMGAQAAWASLMASNAASNPAAPYPTLAAVKGNLGSSTYGPSNSGICVSAGIMVETFTNTDETGATSSTTDLVKSIKSAPKAETTCP